MSGERKVSPNCVNAGNPFHQCADYCGQRSSQDHPKLKIDGGGKSPAFNGGGIRVEGRIADPDCVNASNPFHQCAEYCVKKTSDSKKQGSGRFAFPVLSKLSPKSHSNRSDGVKSVPSGRSVGTEGRNVNPSCVNAGNPFHQCGDYCNKKATDAREQIRMGKTVQNGELGKVDPMFAHATNSFHQCTEHLQRTTSATRQANGHTLGALLAIESEEETISRKKIKEEEPIKTGAKESGEGTSSQENIKEEEPIKTGARESGEGTSSRENIKEEEVIMTVSRVSGKGTSSRENIEEEEPIMTRFLLASGGAEGTSSRENIKRAGFTRENIEEDEIIMEEEVFKGNIKEEVVIRENMKEAAVIKEHKKVDPRCPNASNPFHECADYCLEKISVSGRSEGGKPDRSKRRTNIVTEIKGVDPRCVNASNPFHQCAEYCFKRIHDAT